MLPTAHAARTTHSTETQSPTGPLVSSAEGTSVVTPSSAGCRQYAVILLPPYQSVEFCRSSRGQRVTKNIHDPVLGVLLTVHGDLVAYHTETGPCTAALKGTAFTTNIHHPVLGVLLAVHGDLATLHTEERSYSAALV